MRQWLQSVFWPQSDEPYDWIDQVAVLTVWFGCLIVEVFLGYAAFHTPRPISDILALLTVVVALSGAWIVLRSGIQVLRSGKK